MLSEVEQNDALLRFFFKIEPSTLDDEEWANMVGQMWWALKTTGRAKSENGKITFYNG